jgi:hypothetical protein
MLKSSLKWQDNIEMENKQWNKKSVAGRTDRRQNIEESMCVKLNK